MPLKYKKDHTFTCPLLANVFNVLIMKHLMLKFEEILGAWNQVHSEGREEILVIVEKEILSISTNKLYL